MATILSYAPPARRTAARFVGPCAAALAVCSSALIVATTFHTRYTLASYVGGGGCGTAHASLEVQLFMLPMLLFVPLVAGAAVADHLRCGGPACRVSFCVSILGWAACAFAG